MSSKYRAAIKPQAQPKPRVNRICTTLTLQISPGGWERLSEAAKALLLKDAVNEPSINKRGFRAITVPCQTLSELNQIT